MTFTQFALAMAATALISTALLILIPHGNWLFLLFLSTGSAAIGALSATIGGEE